MYFLKSGTKLEAAEIGQNLSNPYACAHKMKEKSECAQVDPSTREPSDTDLGLHAPPQLRCAGTLIG